MMKKSNLLIVIEILDELVVVDNENYSEEQKESIKQLSKELKINGIARSKNDILRFIKMFLKGFFAGRALDDLLDYFESLL